MILLLLLIFALIALYELPWLAKKGYWPEMITFLVFLGAGATVSFLIVLGVSLPSMTDLMTSLVKAVWK